jgi:hypothetical protein
MIMRYRHRLPSAASHAMPLRASLPAAPVER